VGKHIRLSLHEGTELIAYVNVPVDERVLRYAVLDFGGLLIERSEDKKGIGAATAERLMERRSEARRSLEELTMESLYYLLRGRVS
jgi:hypothetical protein